MTTKSARRRTFGSVRKLPSGRYQARYTGSDGLQHTAPTTFASKADANVYLATQETDIVREAWKAPKHANVTLGEYGRTWIAQRPIKPSTRERYRSAWNLHIDPLIGSLMIGDVSPAVVREWYAGLGDHLRRSLTERGRRYSTPDLAGTATLAHAYRLLKAVMNTALEDELIPGNPCRIKGASTYRHAERPTLGINEIEELAQQVPERYKAQRSTCSPGPVSGSARPLSCVARTSTWCTLRSASSAVSTRSTANTRFRPRSHVPAIAPSSCRSSSPTNCATTCAPTPPSALTA